MDVDGVVLDIDGVLLDVSESYRRTVVETADHLYGDTVPKGALHSLKDAGGFNNDWLLTDALCLYVLARRVGYDTDIDGYASAIADHGGGLDGARDAITEALGPEDATAVKRDWDPDRVRSVFQQYYLGSDGYREIERAEPDLDTPGYMHDEPVLIDAGTLEALRREFAIGVLTGRPAREATLALDRLHLELPDDRVLTMDSPFPGKPAPDGLVALAARLDAEAIAYVGDTLDDVRTAVAATDTDPGRRYAGLGVLTGGLTGPAGREAFQSAGATAVIDSINELPENLGL
jgi:HAD superfamily hydrolase (TIGR01548 family)